MTGKQRRTVSLVAVVGFVAAAGAFLLWPASQAGALLAPGDSTVVAAGRDIYVQQCAACHGVNLEGQPNWRQPGPDGKLPAPPHDETGHTWHHSDELLFAITKFGTAKVAGLDEYETDMPVYEGTLSDAEIVAVLSYIKSKWPDAVRERHDAMNANR